MADQSPTAPQPTLQEAAEAHPIAPVPSEHLLPPPTPVYVDVAQLLPTPVQLDPPRVCGDFTVYDEEDVSTLCSASTLAATPITSPNCPQAVSGSVRLETDLLCADTDGLIVVADNTVIDLNGHTIRCVSAAGYFGSCQGPVQSDFDDGIETNNRDNVHIFSHVPGGTIDGFDRGIIIRQDSDNIKVKQVVVTGPAGAPGAPRPRFVVGIQVFGVDCDGGHVRIGGGTRTGNDVSHHNRGIEATNSGCVYIGYNRVHDNRKNVFAPTGGNHAIGISVAQSPNNHVRSNVVTNNGDDFPNEAGIALFNAATTSTLVVENESNSNMGNGVETLQGAIDNYINNNQMLGNTAFDAASDQVSVNRWNKNNRCITQTTPQPPPGVCGPDEAPPPE